MCKPWKINGVRTEAEGGEKFSDHKQRFADFNDLPDSCVC
jgi:hypothetical protein